MGNLDTLELFLCGKLMRPCGRASQGQQVKAEQSSMEAYVNLMLGVFLGGGKNSSWFL